MDRKKEFSLPKAEKRIHQTGKWSLIIINVRGQIDNRMAHSYLQTVFWALQLIGSLTIIRWISTNQGTLLKRENHLRAVSFEVYFTCTKEIIRQS